MLSRAATSVRRSGITGTPVVDAGAGEIFAVADEFVNGAPAHFLIGLNMYSGTVMLNQEVDPPASAPPPSCSAPG